MRFFPRNIKTFNIHTLLPQYMKKSIISIGLLETCITPQALSVIFIKSQNVIIIPNRWNKIKLCFCFSTCIFIVKQRMIFCKQLTCIRWQDVKIMMSTWDRFITCNKWKIFSGNVGKKEIILPKMKNWKNGSFFCIYMIIPMHEYVYKCVVVISNWNYPMVLLDKMY